MYEGYIIANLQGNDANNKNSEGVIQSLLDFRE
jgi:hypothetical protein